MRTRLLWFLVPPAMIFCLTALSVSAKQSKGDPKDGEAIQKQAEAFIEAFHKGDAKAVAAFWTPDGDYTDLTGRQIKGREAIEKAFADLFAQTKGLKIRIDSDSLRFVTPEVAIEDGTSEVYPPDGARRAGPATPSSTRRRTGNGSWPACERRRFLRRPTSTCTAWSGQSAIGPVKRKRARRTGSRSPGMKTRISSSQLSRPPSKAFPLGGAKQWIGWDPIAKNVRSWIFDATGGFGEGAWTQRWRPLGRQDHLRSSRRKKGERHLHHPAR